MFVLDEDVCQFLEAMTEFRDEVNHGTPQEWGGAAREMADRAAKLCEKYNIVYIKGHEDSPATPSERPDENGNCSECGLPWWEGERPDDDEHEIVVHQFHDGPRELRHFVAYKHCVCGEFASRPVFSDGTKGEWE